MIAHRPLVRVPMLVTSATLAVVALAACSSSGSSGSPATRANPPAQQPTKQVSGGGGTTVTATETEFHIALSTAKLSAGTVTFRVKNAGQITHALTVDGPGVDKSTSDISPGDSATLTVNLEAGKYDVFCPVGDHKMEGMDETVQVG